MENGPCCRPGNCNSGDLTLKQRFLYGRTGSNVIFPVVCREK